MKKSTEFYCSLVSIPLNFTGALLMAMTGNWIMFGVGMLFLYISWNWIMTNIMPIVEDLEDDDALH